MNTIVLVIMISLVVGCFIASRFIKKEQKPSNLSPSYEPKVEVDTRTKDEKLDDLRHFIY